MSRHTCELSPDIVHYTSIDGIEKSATSGEFKPPFFPSEVFELDVIGSSVDSATVEWTGTADGKTGFDITAGRLDYTEADRQLVIEQVALRICALADNMKLGITMRHQDPFPRSPAALRKKYAKPTTPKAE